MWQRLGHSWGTVLALEYALRHSTHVARLILMNPAPASASDVAVLRKAYLERLGADMDLQKEIVATAAYQTGDPETVAARYRIHFEHALVRPEDYESLTTRMKAAFVRQGREGIVKARAVEDRLYRDTWQALDYDLMPKLGALRIPTLVLTGGVKGQDRWRYGPYAPMVQGMSRFYNSMWASVGTMDNLEPVLKDNAFRDAREVRKTRARLEAFRERTRNIDADIDAAAGRLLADIEHADVPDYMRAKMLEGIRSGMRHSPIRVTAQVTPMVDALEELVAFMESRRGRYHYEDGELVFDVDPDAARFNRLLDGVLSLQSRAKADTAWRRERLKDTTATFGEWAEDPFNRRPPDRK